MHGLNDEENIEYWTRGDLHGEWTITDSDLDTIYQEIASEFTIQLYDGNDTMKPHMTSNEAMRYNWKYRRHQGWKARTLPWDVNLLNAFHNLHFIMYMADKVPDFNELVKEGEREYKVGVPAKDVWILQMVMKAATDCLRDDFIKISKERDPHDYRVTPRFSSYDGRAGFELHIVSDCLFCLWVDFNPIFNKDGTLGCTYKVALTCGDWNRHRKPIYGKGATDNPLRENMLRMRSYVKKELKRFSKMLADAEFNKPEYALKDLCSPSDPLYTVFKKLIDKYGLREGWFHEDYKIKNATIRIGDLDYELMRFDCVDYGGSPLTVFSKVSVVDKKLLCGSCYDPTEPKTEEEAETQLKQLIDTLETTFKIKLNKG